MGLYDISDETSIYNLVTTTVVESSTLNQGQVWSNKLQFDLLCEQIVFLESLRVVVGFFVLFCCWIFERGGERERKCSKWLSDLALAASSVKGLYSLNRSC